MTDEKEELQTYFGEHPFARKGMTKKEYTEELIYYYKHMDDVLNDTYVPLWQQREGQKNLTP